MPRDYKNRAAPKRKKKQLTPPWVWMLVGLLVGAFVVGLAWLKTDDAANGIEWVGAKPDNSPKKIEVSSAVKKKVDVAPHQPRFEFFDKLRDQEVVVSDEQLALRKGINGTDPTARYIVQIGSFIKSSDAERMKAELALLGVESRVNAVQLASNKKRFRVTAGPYLGQTVLNENRKRLMSNGYKDLLVRILK